VYPPCESGRVEIIIAMGERMQPESSDNDNDNATITRFRVRRSYSLRGARAAPSENRDKRMEETSLRQEKCGSVRPRDSSSTQARAGGMSMTSSPRRCASPDVQRTADRKGGLLRCAPRWLGASRPRVPRWRRSGCSPRSTTCPWSFWATPPRRKSRNSSRCFRRWSRATSPSGCTSGASRVPLTTRHRTQAGRQRGRRGWCHQLPAALRQCATGYAALPRAGARGSVDEAGLLRGAAAA
jgi:hypothetical protein